APAPSSTEPVIPTSAAVSLRTVPPPPLQGAVVAALRRPARALRTDGSTVYAVGLPFTALRVDPVTGETTEVAFGGQFHDAAGQWLGTGVRSGHVVVHVADQPRSNERLLVVGGEASTITNLPIPTSEPTMLAAPFSPNRSYITTRDTGRIAEIDMSSMT